MAKIRSRNLLVLLVCLSGAFAIIASQGPLKKPTPPTLRAEFVRFEATPNPICTNVGVPIVRVTWNVDGVGNSCLVNLRINGEIVNGALWCNGTSECGRDKYSREVAFSLSDQFGNNIPSQITFEAGLTGGPFVAQSPFQQVQQVVDTATSAIRARECTPSILPKR